MGSSAAHSHRLIRESNRDVELVLAGRNPEKGAVLAQELGHASAAHLDLEATVGNLPSVDLFVAALYDPANLLVDAALRHGIAHIGITTKADDVAPIAFAALKATPKRPIVFAGPFHGRSCDYHCSKGGGALQSR